VEPPKRSSVRVVESDFGVVNAAPETRYARRGEVALAYQVLGDGPMEVMFVAGGQYPIDLFWDEPRARHFVQRLSSIGRVAMWDARGWASSGGNPDDGATTLEDWADDFGVVMDAVGFERPAVIGVGPGASFSMFFAAARPERVRALVLMEAFARYRRSDDYPIGIPDRAFELAAQAHFAVFGTGETLQLFAPSAADDPRFRAWWARCERMGADPLTANRNWRELASRDVRAALPSLRVPTLVLHRRGDRFIHVEHGRYIAEHISGATFVELEGDDHIFFIGDADGALDQIELFLTGQLAARAPDRMLATVLFTDIVDSTGQAARLGDRRWTELLDAHDQLVTIHLDRYRGRKVNPTGDGMLATFDGPARAIRCAIDIRDSVRDLGLQIRAGLHVGEVEQRDADLGGIAVHIGARVQAHAQPDEVLVSRTVVDLVAGSGIIFDDRGEHDLKGVPGPWRLFAVHN